MCWGVVEVRCRGVVRVCNCLYVISAKNNFFFYVVDCLIKTIHCFKYC